MPCVIEACDDHVSEEIAGLLVGHNMPYIFTCKDQLDSFTVMFEDRESVQDMLEETLSIYTNDTVGLYGFDDGSFWRFGQEQNVVAQLESERFRFQLDILDGQVVRLISKGDVSKAFVGVLNVDTATKHGLSGGGNVYHVTAGERVMQVNPKHVEAVESPDHEFSEPWFSITVL